MTQQPAERFESRGAAAAGPDAARRSGWTRVLGHGVLPGLMLLLALVAGGLKWWDSSSRAADLARTESVRAAVDSAITILSYTPDTAEQDVADAEQLLTGRARDRFAEAAHGRVIPEVKARHVTATASVPGAASISATPSHAVALVFVDQTIAVGPEAPTVVGSSYQVTLDLVGGRWLVSGFDPV
ncbi:MAG TPA: hypothetical protein VFR17_10980 [Mycobacterium sp.]|nr:hypothetical protein [Mycobacterium sp.]